MSKEHQKVSAATVQDRMRRSERAHLIDVRSAAEYADGHAAGAVSMPIDKLDRMRVRARLGEDVGKGEPLHLICASGLRAQQAAGAGISESRPG